MSHRKIKYKLKGPMVDNNPFEQFSKGRGERDFSDWQKRCHQSSESRMKVELRDDISETKNENKIENEN